MPPNIEINSSATLLDIEKTLEGLPPRGGAERLKLRLELDTQDALLVDIWGAILAGTVCRAGPTDVTYAMSDESDATETQFALSLAGLTCASIASSIKRRLGPVLDTRDLQQKLMLTQAGLVTPDSDVSQLLIEFDQEYSLSSLFLLSDGSIPPPRLRQRLFEKQVLQFRQLLDLGALRRGSGPVGKGGAGEVGRFLAELHENGLEHGTRGVNGALDGTRFLRVRTHNAASRAELVQRCGPFRQLRRYVDDTFAEGAPVTLLEAAISDFGLGIVDAFQASPAGLGPDVDRTELLHELIYGRLTSKSDDPSAGLGIQNALEAAENMQAFVSLRTAEFWLVASFMPGQQNARLKHLQLGRNARVAGTHWQIFWPHPQID